MSTQKKREGGLGLKERSRDETKEPPLYRVILHNDDYTPQDFVVELLIAVFRLEPGPARSIMLRVHTTGKGIAGVYSREVAETKTEITRATARAHGHPLEVSFEPDR